MERKQSATAHIHRINELESGIERLRNHQEILKRKLKKQSGKKTKLEVSKFENGNSLSSPLFHQFLNYGSHYVNLNECTI